MVTTPDGVNMASSTSYGPRTSPESRAASVLPSPPWDPSLPWLVPWHWRQRKEGSGWVQRGYWPRRQADIFTFRQVRNEKVSWLFSLQNSPLSGSNLEFPSFGHVFYALKGLVLFSIHIQTVHFKSWREGRIRHMHYSKEAGSIAI